MRVRRLAAAAAAAVVITLVGAPAFAGPPAAPTTTQSGYWGCAGVQAIDLGLCVKDPIPHPLPVPQVSAP
ncbi:MAG TPA: hypothetical protein VHN98_04070 [Acidimicrobiales bacterium]|nr:hypothetical protein [Acidimicrobiales bacterium]